MGTLVEGPFTSCPPLGYTSILRDLQRWAVLAGSFRTDVEEVELMALIQKLEGEGRVLSPPCTQTRRGLPTPDRKP